MKRSLLARLQTNGIFYIIGALLLLLGAPIYQALILNPTGYAEVVNTSGPQDLVHYLTWLREHSIQISLYRIILAGAFALLITLPFSLYRIIVAQEILGQQERASEEPEEDEDDEDGRMDDGMPAFAWRGKGFAVLAAWAGLSGLIIYIAGAVASTIYLITVARGYTAGGPLPENYAIISSIFTISTNTVGIGLIAIATLFFGAMIARSGLRLWPGIWVAFSYMALAITALLSGSAVAVASDPTQGQSPLTVPAILFFALWALWLGIMLVRLKPEE